MNTPEIQQLKMAWLAAKEAGNTEEQLHLLRAYPSQQTDLINFIAAYHATNGQDEEQPLALTQRAIQTALEHVFAAPQTVPATLIELRAQRNLTKAAVAQALRLSIDVWQLFEDGTIELVSLSQQHVNRLAQFFQVSSEQFGAILSNSQPSLGVNLRQKGAQRPVQKKSLKQAVAHSTMSQEDKKFWNE